MKKRFLIAPLLLLLLVGCFDKQPINERFPQAWYTPKGEEHTLIAEAIVATKIKDCGQFYIKKNPTKDVEYLVACTKDGGASWRYYYMDLTFGDSMEEAEEDDYQVLKAPNRDR